MHAPNQSLRRLTIFIVFLFTTFSALPQDDDDGGPQQNDNYGRNGKKIKTVRDGGRWVKISYFDPTGQERETIITEEELTQKVVTHEYRDCKGRLAFFERTITKLKTGEEINFLQNKFEKDGKQISAGYRKFLNEKGEVQISKYNKDKKDWERVQPDAYVGRLEFQPDYESCPINNHGIDLFAGYSHLKLDGDFADDALCGWELTGMYPLSNRWKVGLDIGGYYKSTDDFEFNLYLYQVLIMYYMVNSRNPNKKLQFLPFLHAGAGAASYKSEFNIPGIPKFESKETSFAGLIGGGVDLNWGKKLGARLFQTDYVLSTFSDQSQSNFRVSTGLVLRLGSVE